MYVILISLPTVAIMSSDTHSEIIPELHVFKEVHTPEMDDSIQAMRQVRMIKAVLSFNFGAKSFFPWFRIYTNYHSI